VQGGQGGFSRVHFFVVRCGVLGLQGMCVVSQGKLLESIWFCF